MKIQLKTAIVAPPRRKPSPAFARVHAAAASRASRTQTQRSGSANTSPESDSAQPTAKPCRSMSDPLLQRRKHSEQGGCGDAACGSWPARDVRSYQPAAKSRVTCKRGLRGCSLWKLACERFSIQQHQRSSIANRLQKGGQRGSSLWKLACARSAYQSSKSFVPCISDMHPRPPRSALPCEPHATASAPGPHVARATARAARAHTSRVTILTLN